MTGEVLLPLAERYLAGWRRPADATDDGAVRALPLVLRLEREPVPSWTAAATLAAAGSAAICLDDRAETGGEWHDAVRSYLGGAIRKVTRRARGAAWAAVQDVPGLSCAWDATEVRVLVPGPVDGLDRRVGWLQVGGTDAPVDAAPAAGFPDDPGVLAVLVTPDPPLTLGKAMAQTGHAGMIAAALLAADDQPALNAWRARGLPVHVRIAEPAAWATECRAASSPAGVWSQDRLLAVRDAGFTEVAPGTVTALARAPLSLR